MNKMIIAAVAIFAVGGAAGFFVGHATGNDEQFPRGELGANMRGMQGDQNGATVRQGINGGFGGGEIIAKDDASITVKLPDGGSRIVFFSDSTAITKLVAGIADDLAEGVNVIVRGSQNDDGSMTADSIQIVERLTQ